MSNTTTDIKANTFISTAEAFAHLIVQKNICKILEVDKSVVARWKQKAPTINKMEEMLLKAGAKVVSEKIWSIN